MGRDWYSNVACSALGIALGTWMSVGYAHPAQEAGSATPSPPRADGTAGATALPPNLEFPEKLQPTLERMWRYSPTFRRQCARLAAAPEVRVVLATSKLPVQYRGEAYAITHIRSSGPTGMHAEIWLGFERLEESIAHELEHIIERIDGVDVARLAERRIDGVARLGQAFETVRAKHMGRAVADELQSSALLVARRR